MIKILIKDVKRTYEKVLYIKTLEELMSLCLKYNLTLIEVVDYNRINNCPAKDYELERVKNCSIILKEHNDYIE